jgi:hypothetical protein
MRLTIYARKTLNVHSVLKASSATGIGGVLGNKGGLVVRLNIEHTVLAFCSCHLAAHEGAAHNGVRNAQCREVMRETYRVIGGERKLDAAHVADHLIWLGDLNYRVDLSISGVQPAGVRADKERHEEHVKAVQAIVAEEKWEELLAADQLRHAREQGDAFVGFTEAESFGFAPTFKVLRQPGTTYKTQRTPSYCDRILWRSMAPSQGRLALTRFDSVPAVSTSDHKPVRAVFELMPSPQVRMETVGRMVGRTETSTTVVRLRKLSVHELIASDLTGTSDPFCLFYTHPHGLLVEEAGRRPPRTTVKTRVQGNQAHISTGDATYTKRITKGVSRRSFGSGTRDSSAAWTDEEVCAASARCEAAARAAFA